MADVQTSTLAAAGTSGALILAQWIVSPEWPPPLPVLTVIVGILTPIVHLLGRAINNRLQIIVDRLDDGVVNASVTSTTVSSGGVFNGGSVTSETAVVTVSSGGVQTSSGV